MDLFSLKPKLTGSSYIHIFILCQTNQRVSANKFKFFPQSVLIKKNSHLAALVTLTHNRIHVILCKTSSKIHLLVFFFSLFQLHCAFQKNTFRLQRFMMQCKTGCVFVLLGKEQQSTQGLSGRDLAARCRAPEEHWHSFHPSPRNVTSLGCGPAEAQAGMWACGLGSRPDLERGPMDGLGGPWKWGQGQAKSTSGDGGDVSPRVKLYVVLTLRVPQTSKGRVRCVKYGERAPGKTFSTPLWSNPSCQYQVRWLHIFTQTQGRRLGALMQILLLAMFTLQHYLSKRCSCFSSGMSKGETEFLKGREVEGMHQWE